MVDFKSRLERFLTDRGRPIDIKQLTPDASTREYFRIMWKDSTAIACVYPEAFVAAEQSYLDVTNLFRVNGLPVAEILDVDEALGVIVQEDFGDTILRDVITKAGENERERLIDDAIHLI
ncbi:MAG TPA: hypothetical protein VGQ55_01810, partial [Pyrinomonadaceae bacterium]|nr:hypothetical protein [Pyrinomonadaceae bacterium]